MLLCVGRTGYAPFREAIERYLSRIPHYVPFELREIPDIKNTKNISEARQKEMEGTSILASISNSDLVVLLDEKGKEYTSREFARFIEDKMIGSVQRIVFIVGGPYGFSDKVYDRADMKVSLSRMTFSHEMVRLFFIEQIYRAMTILHNEPYHHD